MMTRVVGIRRFNFSLGVSVLVHGLVLGGVGLVVQHQRTPAIVSVSEPTTVEFIAAPAAMVEEVVAVLTEAVSLPQPPEPTPVPEVLLPKPEPEPIEPVFLPVSPVEMEPAPAEKSVPLMEAGGDNSSPVPGFDAVTVPGKPTLNAQPNYRRNPEPEYPLMARRRGQQGTVVLLVTVDAAGRPTEISVQRSSGFDVLDEAALRAVRRWDFEPARVGAEPVASRIEVPVRFTLAR